MPRFTWDINSCLKSISNRLMYYIYLSSCEPSCVLQICSDTASNGSVRLTRHADVLLYFSFICEGRWNLKFISESAFNSRKDQTGEDLTLFKWLSSLSNLQVTWSMELYVFHMSSSRFRAFTNVTLFFYKAHAFLRRIALYFESLSRGDRPSYH